MIATTSSTCQLLFEFIGDDVFGMCRLAAYKWALNCDCSAFVLRKVNKLKHCVYFSSRKNLKFAKAKILAEKWSHRTS